MVVAGTKRKPPQPQTAVVRMVPLNDLVPCPENEYLYRPVDPQASDVRALAVSVQESGIREPLVITEDNVILSGHRRREAATIAGLTEVPCRVEPIQYDDLTSDEVVRLLREYNRQRVKSLDEMLREEVVSVDRSLAYERLLEHRDEMSDLSDNSLAQVPLAEQKKRKGISRRKQAMLDAVLEVIEEREEFWPLSDRQIHYVLLNNPPLRNSLRPGSRYANDRNSYGDLCDLLTRARLAGLIPWPAISDDTRPTTRWRCYAGARDFVQEQLDDLFQNYARDLQHTQPNHVEIVAEKLTVRNIVERVASRYALPVTIGRGYCSITPRYQMAQRFHGSGKSKLIVLILSDFDPDGEAIAESFARSMRDDFNIDALVPVKVALTGAQVKELGLPPGMKAKKSSRQFQKFADRHGTDVYELEAVPPDALQQLLTEAIDAVLEPDLLNREIDAESEDAAFLETARQRACLALADMREDP